MYIVRMMNEYINNFFSVEKVLINKKNNNIKIQIKEKIMSIFKNKNFFVIIEDSSMIICEKAWHISSFFKWNPPIVFLRGTNNNRKTIEVHNVSNIEEITRSKDMLMIFDTIFFKPYS